MRSIVYLCSVLGLASIAPLTGCETEPKAENQTDFMARATESTAQFKRTVKGLDDQIQKSAAYIIFPDVAQFGIIAGTTSGRGALCKPDGTQIGWAAVNTASLGLQAGVQGFRMLVVLENQATLEKFKNNQLQGSANVVAVASEAGGSGTAAFRNGVVMYQGANRGLMAGVDLSLDYLRYKSLAAEAASK